MINKDLNKIGLSNEQLDIYNLLLQHGSIQAGRLSILSGLKRPYVYKILQQLIDLGLVEKDTESKITRFIPAHPHKIKVLLEDRIKELRRLDKEFEMDLNDLVSKYNLVSGKPNVQFFEGRKGIKKLYDDINQTSNDLMLFRSPYDRNYEYLADLTGKQIEKQVRKNIHTRALTPAHEEGVFDPDFDKQMLITRKNIPRETFKIPAQIIIYGNKVGITSYKKGVFTTIIDNKDISDTFKIIFEQIWNCNK